MGKKMRPGAERDALGQQAADLRRGAPGKRFVGDRAAQSLQAKRQEVERVVRMADENAAERHREELREESVAAVLVELFVESLKLARTFAVAPFRIMAALRRVRGGSGAEA